MAKSSLVKPSEENGSPRGRKGDRAEEIVTAAFEEFAAKGYSGTRLEDVAARAKVSKGLPYLYFKTKEELFNAVVRSVLTPAFDEMRELMLASDLPSEALLKGPLLAFLQDLVKSRRMLIARLLISEGHKHPELTRFYYDQVVSKGIAALRTFIDRGVARGEFKPTALHDFPQIIVAPALMAVIWRSLFEAHVHLDTDALLKTHIDLVIDAIAAKDRGRETS